MPRLLLVEDDPEVGALAAEALSRAGHSVEHRTDGLRGLEAALGGGFDAIVLDRHLPGMDGLAVLRALRDSGVATPVLVLSALGETDQRIEGLQAGGDDYMGKPFSLAELCARVSALLRRPAAATPQVKVADLVLDLMQHRAERGGRRIELHKREFRLLEFLMRHAGQVVTRSMLLEGVWGYRFDPQTNLVDVHISRLRAKLDAPGLPALIHTERGVGYLFGVRDTG